MPTPEEHLRAARIAILCSTTSIFLTFAGNEIYNFPKGFIVVGLLISTSAILVAVHELSEMRK
jgi:hypothetical protein